MRKFVIGAIALLVMTFVGCSKDDTGKKEGTEKVKDLKLSQTELLFTSLAPQEVSVEGSGDYDIEWSVGGKTSEETLNLKFSDDNTKLTITPLKFFYYEDALTITDKQTKQKATLKVEIEGKPLYKEGDYKIVDSKTFEGHKIKILRRWFNKNTEVIDMQADPILRQVTHIHKGEDGSIFVDIPVADRKLKKVIFSKNIKEIGYNAFEGCINLEEISMQPNSVERLGDYAFAGCEKLKTNYV